MIPSETYEDIVTSIKGIYSHLIISDVPSDAPYKGLFSERMAFGLDENGYYVWYLKFLQSVLASKEIGDKWSVAGIEERTHELLIELANIKYHNVKEVDLNKITSEWLNKIELDFPIIECLLPVIGLQVKLPITIGAVTFLPLESKKQEIEARASSNFFKELSPYSDCLASAKFTAEPRKSTEILRDKTEEALNLLRYIGSLVRPREDPRHIYVAGQEKRRTSYCVVVYPNGLIGETGYSEYSPVPYTIDDEYLQYANFYGFDFFQEIFRKDERTQIQQAFLIAIQWYGDAIQEKNPLIAFSKFYTSIETVSKLKKENAKMVLPRRLRVLIEPWDRTDQSKLEIGIRGMISDRNSVIHSGRPSQHTPEYLAWFSRIMAMQTLHHLRLLITSENIQTIDDLKGWADKQYDECFK